MKDRVERLYLVKYNHVKFKMLHGLVATHEIKIKGVVVYEMSTLYFILTLNLSFP